MDAASAKRFWHNFLERQIAFYQDNRITRLGYIFIAFSFLIGMAAVNTGVNLLYLLFSIIICLIILNGWLALMMFSKLRVGAQIPDTVFAGRSYPLHITLENRKRFLSSYSLFIQDQGGGNEIISHDYCLRIPARESIFMRCQRRLPRRGWYEFEGISIQCVFPFGLVERVRHYRDRERILVLPNVDKPGRLHEIMQRGLEAQPLQRVGSGHDIFDVHPYQGEDRKHIHWKLSAKKNELMTKDFEEEAAPVASLVFYASPCSQQALDHCVDEIASFIWSWTGQLRSVTLFLPGQAPLHSLGRSGVDEMLRALALIEPSSEKELLQWWQGLAGHQGSALIVHPREGGAPPARINGESVAL